MAKMLSVSRMQARFNLVTSFRFELPLPTADSISERFLLHFYVTIFRAVCRVSQHAAQHIHTQMHIWMYMYVCAHTESNSQSLSVGFDVLRRVM